MTTLELLRQAVAFRFRPARFAWIVGAFLGWSRWRRACSAVDQFFWPDAEDPDLRRDAMKFAGKDLDLAQVIDIGEHVECDFCSKDYTGKPDQGGLLFQSKATCPECAPRIEAGAKGYGEEHLIRARCPAGMAFAAWVLSLRSGDNTIRVYS